MIQSAAKSGAPVHVAAKSKTLPAEHCSPTIDRRRAERRLDLVFARLEKLPDDRGRCRHYSDGRLIHGRRLI